ncbi:MAG: ankyrin repeat domain-containing protein [Alphaproteobacteria bacterium]
MQLFKILILCAAAYGGYIYYQRFHAISNVADGMESSRESSGRLQLQNSTGGIGEIGGLGNIDDEHDNTATTFRGPGQPAPKKDPYKLDLLRAAAAGDVKKVSDLLEKTSARARDAHRRTPLIHAAWHGHKEVCAKLLAAGANIEFQDREGHNALDYAAGSGQMEVVRYLLVLSGKKDDRYYEEFSRLMASVLTNHLPSVTVTGKPGYINRITPSGQSPIHTAASNGYVPMAERLVELGADVKLENENRQTPLHWASWNNHASMIAFLRAQGANLNVQDKMGNTPLLMAVENGSVDAVSALLKEGAKKNIKNDKGQTALMIAADKGNKSIQELLQ